MPDACSSEGNKTSQLGNVPIPLHPNIGCTQQEEGDQTPWLCPSNSTSVPLKLQRSANLLMPSQSRTGAENIDNWSARPSSELSLGQSILCNARADDPLRSRGMHVDDHVKQCVGNLFFVNPVLS